jgi:hypothetical protein
MKKIITLIACTIALNASWAQPVKHTRAASKLIAKANYYNFNNTGQIYVGDTTSFTINADCSAQNIANKYFDFLTIGQAPQVNFPLTATKEANYDKYTPTDTFTLEYETINSYNSAKNITRSENAYKVKAHSYNNNRVLYTYDTFIGTTSTYLTEYRYNNINPNLITSTTQLKDGILATAKDSFIYNSNGQLIERLYYSEVSGTLYNHYKDNYYRNANGQMDSVIIENTPYPYTAPLAKSHKIVYVRDNANRPIVINEYKYNTTTMNLDKLHKTDTFTYIGSSIIPDSNDAWTYDLSANGMRKTNWNKYISNANGDITEVRVYYSSYPNGNNPVFASKTKYYYQANIANNITSNELDAKVTLYPNPSTNGEFTINTSDIKSINCYTIDGKLIQLISNGNNKFQINSKGMHFIQIVTNNGTMRTLPLMVN